MPALPAINLTQEHFDRVVAAMPGDTPEQKTQNYIHLVLNTLITFVMDKEMGEMEERQHAARQAEIARIEASLPDMLQFPV